VSPRRGGPGGGGCGAGGRAGAEDDGVPQFAPHHAGEMVGVGPPQHGGTVGNFSGKITVRHIF